MKVFKIRAFFEHFDQNSLSISECLVCIRCHGLWWGLDMVTAGQICLEPCCIWYTQCHKSHDISHKHPNFQLLFKNPKIWQHWLQRPAWNWTSAAFSQKTLSHSSLSFIASHLTSFSYLRNLPASPDVWICTCWFSHTTRGWASLLSAHHQRRDRTS